MIFYKSLKYDVMIMFETYIILMIKSNSDRYLWLVNISQRVYAFTNIIWYLVSINKRLCQDSISKNTIIIKWKNVFLIYAKIINLNIYIRSIWIIYILHVHINALSIVLIWGYWTCILDITSSAKLCFSVMSFFSNHWYVFDFF